MVTPEEITDSWCAMWSEDATLAQELLTDDARQWWGVGNTFAKRTTIIDGNERLAYTWHATRPERHGGDDTCRSWFYEGTATSVLYKGFNIVATDLLRLIYLDVSGFGITTCPKGTGV